MPSLGFGLFKRTGDWEIPTPLPRRLMPPRAPALPNPKNQNQDIPTWRAGAFDSLERALPSGPESGVFARWKGAEMVAQ